MFDLNVDRIQSQNTIRNNIKKFKDSTQEFNPNAFYMAVVVDTQDPYNLGRVRIRIPAIHGVNRTQSYYLPDDSLPWARPAIFNAMGNDMGQFIVPAKGSSVFVSFEYNDASKPLYFGGIQTRHGKDKYYNDNFKIYNGAPITITDDDRIKDLDNSSGQYVVFKSLKGATIIIDDTDGKESLKLIDAAGQVFSMDSNEDVPLDRRGNKTGGTIESSISLKTLGAINFEGTSFKYNGQDVGTSTGNDKNFIFVQSVPSDTWNIPHNLGKYPSVTIIDSGNTQLFGEVQYDSLNDVTIKFSKAFSGKATLN